MVSLSSVKTIRVSLSPFRNLFNVFPVLVARVVLSKEDEEGVVLFGVLSQRV